MKLIVTMPNAEDNVYEVCDQGLELSSVLKTMSSMSELPDGCSDHEEEIGGELEEQTIHLPVTFAHMYMTIIVKFLNYFSNETLPLKIAQPIKSSKLEDIVHDVVLECIDGLSINQLSRLRQIATYFDMPCLLDQLDATLAIEIIQNPKEVFKELHEPNLTLVSRESVSAQFPILS